MKPSQAKAAIALLIAAYPRGSWPASTQEVYARSIEPFAFDDVRRAIERLVATSEFPPSIAEVRREIVEDALGLPGEIEAWMLAEAHASARRPGAPRAKCYACMTTGRRVDGSECEDCGGAGWLDELDLSALPPAPDPIPAAVRSIGGWRAIREATRPDLLRRDFLAAYSRLRGEIVERENLRALGANGDHPLVESASRAIGAEG